MKIALRAVLSLFILYHLLATWVLPNPDSMLHRVVFPYVSGYANMFWFNTTWRFFSPNPVHRRHLAIEIVRDTKSDKDVEVFYWPPKDRTGIWTENYFRRSTHEQRVSSSEQQIKTFLVAWICEKYPDAVSLAIQMEYQGIPTLEKTALEGSSVKELEWEDHIQQQEFYCER